MPDLTRRLHGADRAEFPDWHQPQSSFWEMPNPVSFGNRVWFCRGQLAYGQK